MAQARHTLKMRRIKKEEGKVCSICGKHLWGVIPPERQLSIDLNYLIHKWCMQEKKHEHEQDRFAKLKFEHQRSAERVTLGV